MKKNCRRVSIFGVSILATMLFFMPVMASAVNVGIICGRGIASDKIVAMFRAVNSMGFTIKGISPAYIYSSNFNPAEFDVIIFPAGTDEKAAEYELSMYADGTTICMGNSTVTDKLHSFVDNGGGIIGIERGAQYIIDKLGVLSGAGYTSSSGRSLQTMTITNSNFYLDGNTTQKIFKSGGGGHLNGGSGSQIIAKNSSNQTVIAGNTHSLGRIVLSAYDPELRLDSLADWTQWDNWLGLGTHSNSSRCWQLLGKMINWADTGVAGSPTVSTAEPTGAKVAVVSSWYYKDSSTEDYGGASPALLPAVARSVEYAGYVPTAIRWDEITATPTKLTTSNFAAVVFPGGFSYGYKAKIGYRKTSGGGQKIAAFISSGGDALGICAGSYYLSQTCHYKGTDYPYLGIYNGIDSGPITHPDYNVQGDYIVPGHITLVDVQINDSQLYPTGNDFSMYQMIFAGGYKSSGTFTSSVTFNTGYDDYDSGSPNIYGMPDAIRFMYGSGHVYLIGTHPEARNGSLEDWLLWDNYDSNGSPLTNPDNPWTFVDRVFDNWLMQ